MKRELTYIIILLNLMLISDLSIRAQNIAPYQWNSMAIGGGGYVTGIVTSKIQRGLMYARTDVGGAYRWDQIKDTWVPLTDWASDKQQGVFGVESIALDPNNPSYIYMSTGISYFNGGKSYILRSTDYGAHFSVIDVTDQFKIHGNGYGRQNGEKLQVDPNNSDVLYCGTRWNGLFKSTDSGLTWSRLPGLDVTATPNENGISFVLLDKSSSTNGSTQRIFAGISRVGQGHNFYRSDDGGTTFDAVINPNLMSGLMPQRGIFSGDGNIFIAYGNGVGPGGTSTEPMTSGQIWKYNIAKSTWTDVTPKGIISAFGGISIDPINPNRLVVSTINKYLLQIGNTYGDHFYITKDGGNTWTDVVARGYSLDANGVSWGRNASIHWVGCIEFDPFDTKRVLVTSGNGIFLNEDIEAISGIWKFFVKGLEETVPTNLISIPGGPALSVIRDYDGFKHTDSEDYAVIHTPKIGTTSGLDYAISSKNKVIRVGGDKMYYSLDTGKTWVKTNNICGSDGQVALSADGNILLHSPKNAKLTYRSIDNGTTWDVIKNLWISNGRPVADGLNSNKFYLYDSSNGALNLSTDRGINFYVISHPGSNGSNIIRTVPGREGEIWIALNNGGLKRSRNSGVSFEKLNAVTYCAAVGIGKNAPGKIYETIYIWGKINNGVLGVYESVDEGLNWRRINDNDHQYGGLGNGQFIVGDMNIYGTVYMSTAGRGIICGKSLSNRFIKLKVADFAVDENSIAGNVVAIPEIADVNETNIHNWTILSGNEGSTFSINNSTGEISVAANAVLDFKAEQVYTLDIGMLDHTNHNVRTQITICLNVVKEIPTDLVSR